jgi:hypothetical protein
MKLRAPYTDTALGLVRGIAQGFDEGARPPDGGIFAGLFCICNCRVAGRIFSKRRRSNRIFPQGSDGLQPDSLTSRPAPSRRVELDPIKDIYEISRANYSLHVATRSKKMSERGDVRNCHRKSDSSTTVAVASKGFCALGQEGSGTYVGVR